MNLPKTPPFHTNSTGITLVQAPAFFHLPSFLKKKYLVALGLCCCLWLSLVAGRGSCSWRLSVGFSCSGFLCCRGQTLAAQAQWLWFVGLIPPWHVESSGPGVEPMSPALAGRFLSTMPPGKSHACILAGVFCLLSLCVLSYNVLLHPCSHHGNQQSF